jgi:hypothetical protein
LIREFDNTEVKEKYQVEISIRFAGLENLDTSFDINCAWKSIRENINTSAKENLKYHRLKAEYIWKILCTSRTFK